MIGKLRWKFIGISMLAVIIVTLLLFGIILACVELQTVNQIDNLINFISENDGIMPEYDEKQKSNEFVINKETKFSTRFFAIKLNHEGEIIDAYTDSIASVDKEQAIQIAEEIKDLRSKKGFIHDYFRYLVAPRDYGRIIVVLDCYKDLNNVNSLISMSVSIIILGWFIIFIISSALSTRALGPIAESIDKQKKFVTNAGHDLKTPVAVILADCEVLKMTTEENNEWVESIENQAHRLDLLIKNLLRLANFEEGKSKLEMKEFNIKEVIEEEAKEFRALAKEKNFDLSGLEDVTMTANELSIRQVLTILLDNAVKYSKEGTTISLKCYKAGKQTRFDVINYYDGDVSDKTKLKKMFERFYREDQSRNSSKKRGYGIGLSTAKTIIDQNKGRIFSDIDENHNIIFSVVI